MFHRDVTDEQFKQLVGQLKPWGVPVCTTGVTTYATSRNGARRGSTRGQVGTQHGTSVLEGWGSG